MLCAALRLFPPLAPLSHCSIPHNSVQYQCPHFPSVVVVNAVVVAFVVFSVSLSDGGQSSTGAAS